MHVSHLPPRHLWRVTAVAALTALLVAVLFAFAAGQLAPSGSPPPPSDAAPAQTTAPGGPPTWVTDPLSPPTRAFTPSG